MATAYAFRSNSQFINYVLKNGATIRFVNHLFYTENELIAAELKETVQAGHPDIYIDQNEPMVDTEALTPEAQLLKKVRAQVMAELAAATQKTRDLGGYESNIGGGMVTTQSAGQLGNQHGQTSVVPLEPLKSVLAQATAPAPVVNQEPQTPAEADAANLEASDPVKEKLAQLLAQQK